jgi:hypothetical protein
MQHAGFSHHGFLYWRAKIGVHDCGANRRTSITRELRIGFICRFRSATILDRFFISWFE